MNVVDPKIGADASQDRYAVRDSAPWHWRDVLLRWEVILVVLLAASLPTSIAGWGPREGMAAWAFGVVGLGAAQGLTVAVVYGVIALLATLPGAVVLVARWRSGRRPAPELAPPTCEVVRG